MSKQNSQNIGRKYRATMQLSPNVFCDAVRCEVGAN